jgi:outer membrane protein assembly factor BamB
VKHSLSPKVVTTAVIVVLSLVLCIGCADPTGSNSSDGSSDPDGGVPMEVSNLQLHGGDGSVTVTWTDPDDEDFRYVIAEFDPCTDGIAIWCEGYWVDSGTESLAEEGFDNGTEYRVTVFAYDQNGNQSEGKSGTVVPSDAVPAGLEAVWIDSAVELSWTAPVRDDIEETEVAWHQTDQLLDRVRLPRDTEAHTITNLENDTQYTVTVRSVSADGTILGSSSVTGAPDGTPPDSVYDLIPYVSEDTVSLVWDPDFEDSDTEYHEVRWTPADGGAQPLVVGPDEGTAVIEQLVQGTTYEFTVTTYDASRNGSLPEVVRATPFPNSWYAFPQQIASGPALGPDGTVHFASSGDGGTLYAIEPNGDQKWTFQTSSYSSNMPLVDGSGTVYIATNDGAVDAVSPAGVGLWSTSQTGQSIWSGLATNSREDSIYLLAGNKLRVFSATDGSELWSYAPEDADFRQGGVYPVVGTDGTVYTGSWNGKLYALQEVTEEPHDWWDHHVWHDDPSVGVARAPVALGDDGTLYFSNVEHKLYAVDTQDGTINWTLNHGEATQFGSPILDGNGRLYVSADHKLLAVNASTGTEEWVFDAGYPSIDGSPVLLENGQILFGSDSILYLITTEGEEVWRFHAIGTINPGPVVGANGNVYFTTQYSGFYLGDNPVSSDDSLLYIVEAGLSGIDTSAPWPMTGKTVQRTGAQ